MKTALKYLYALLIIALSAMCASCSSCSDGNNCPRAITTTLEYSNFVALENFENYSTAVIKSPWDSTKVLQSYTFIKKGSAKPKEILGTLIEVPIDNIIVFSSVHAAIIEALGAEEKIIGICEPEYLTSSKLKRLVASGKIADLGPASAPNIEKIIDIDGRFLITSPLENSGMGGIQKLNLPIIEGVDYMENTPLGRTEWIKFYSVLLDKEELADSIFNSVETRYLELSKLAKVAKNKPRLMTEYKYGNTWYLSGNDSYMVNMYKDAGAHYIFEEIKGSGSVPMSFEYVFDKAIDADYWIMKYYAQTDKNYESLQEEFPLYAKFSPYKSKNIYGCNTAVSSYYDDIVIHPEYILEDLIKIFHPELFENKIKTEYFKNLSE